MSNKCEWRDGKFEPCKTLDNMMEWKESINGIFIPTSTIYFCPYCGAKLEKPESKQDPKDWPKEKWIAFYDAVKEFME